MRVVDWPAYAPGDSRSQTRGKNVPLRRRRQRNVFPARLTPVIAGRISGPVYGTHLFFAVQEAVMRVMTLLRAMLVAAMVALPLTASAQDATIGGTITDTTGGALPGVAVTATNEAT